MDRQSKDSQDRDTAYSGPPRIAELRRSDNVALTTEVAGRLRNGSMVVVRDCEFTPDALRAFARELGEPFVPVTVPTTDKPGEATQVKDEALPRYTANWHFDQSFADRPPDWSLLYCNDPGELVVPTVFADCALLLEFLTPAFVRHLEQLQATHVAAYPDDESWDGVVFAQATHDVIIDVPGGRRGTFVAPGAVRSFVGWTVRESAGVLQHLFEMLNWPEVSVVHHWRRGDLLAWPNKRYAHRVLPLRPQGTRHHTRVVGHWKDAAP